MARDHLPNGPLERLRSCSVEGFGFGEALAVLDSIHLDGENAILKMQLDGSRVYHGVDLVMVSHLGAQIEIPLTQAAANARGIMLWALREVITPEVETVLEIGAGRGELIASLARENVGLSKRFIGTDIDPESIACIDLLGKIGHVPIETRIFDATAPDFDFLAGRTVVVVNGVLNLFDAPTVCRFFDAVADIPDLKAICLFDIISDIGQVFPGTPPMRSFKVYGHGGLLEGLRHIQPRLGLTRGIPHLTSRRARSPHSYFQLEPQ